MAQNRQIDRREMDIGRVVKGLRVFEIRRRDNVTNKLLH